MSNERLVTFKSAILSITIFMLLSGCNSKNFKSDSDFIFYVSPLRYEETRCQQLKIALEEIKHALAEQDPAHPIPYLKGERYTLKGDKRLREISGHQTAITRTIERRKARSGADGTEVCPS